MQRACRVLAGILLSLCLLPPLRAHARDVDYECAMFPACVLEVSQIPYGNYSHAEVMATDILPEGDVFAPFTGQIVHMDSSYGYVVLQSLDKVHWADGSLDYMSVGFMHDNDTSDLQTGQIIRQGTPFYQAGMRSPDGYVTAPHVHLVVIRGKAEGLSNPFRGTDFPFDAFFLSEDTEIIQGVRMVMTPGHTWDSASLFVPSSGDGMRYAIAGDAVPKRSNLEKKKVPALNVSREEAMRSMERIVRWADIVVPGHEAPFRTDGLKRLY